MTVTVIRVTTARDGDRAIAVRWRVLSAELEHEESRYEFDRYELLRSLRQRAEALGHEIRAWLRAEEESINQLHAVRRSDLRAHRYAARDRWRGAQASRAASDCCDSSSRRSASPAGGSRSTSRSPSPTNHHPTRTRPSAGHPDPTDRSPVQPAPGHCQPISACVPTVRSAWDGRPLQLLTRTAPARASAAHISIIGHITAIELRHHLTQIELANGLANRFLLVCCRRTRLLPEGGSTDPLAGTGLIAVLGGAIQHASTAGRVRLDQPARELWHHAYTQLATVQPAGIAGALYALAEAHTVLRLSSFPKSAVLLRHVVACATML